MAPPSTIDRQAAIEVFHRLMQPDSDYRIVLMEGDSKLGKSHLVDKVFPAIAQELYGVVHAKVDLRTSAKSPYNILHNLFGLLGAGNVFPSFESAYEQMLIQSRVDVSRSVAMFSRIEISAGGALDRDRHMLRHLVSKFALDLSEATTTPILLLFDSVDEAEESVLNWIMDPLLVFLYPLSHVKVVLAGRSVPEPCGTYEDICCTHRLLPVQSEDEYIAFCREIGIVDQPGEGLTNDTIRAFARACEYKPGFFFELVFPTFTDLRRDQ